MKQKLRFNEIIKPISIIGNLFLLNIIFVLLYDLFDVYTLGEKFADSLPRLLILLNLTYLICNYESDQILQERIVRPERIVRQAIRDTILHAILFISILSLSNFGILSARFFVSFYTIFGTSLALFNLYLRLFIKRYRRTGGNSRTVLFIGADENMKELYHEMTSDATYGFRVIGYFADNPSEELPKKNFYLGLPSKALPYLRENKKIEHVYCGLSSEQCSSIIPMINYCENHLIRFYSVPNIRSYLKRQMYLDMLGNVPILTIRREPLAKIENRFIKRLFDIFFSLIFLCTLFPVIYIVIGTAIKISSPGPIFFKQKRSGQNGKDFWCYKFRSMRVNKDSDKIQATKNDPRKTRLGNFLRKSNIDELPQFINVFIGDMSVVGPRPHMLKHTEEYSKLVDKYMVRHFVKPGVTGWAQVTGYRGETNELWQMEGRVERDIWYLEHWTPLLDIYIIYRTIRNVIKGEEKAY